MSLAFDFTNCQVVKSALCRFKSEEFVVGCCPKTTWQLCVWSVLLPYCLCFSHVILSFGTDCCWSHSELCQTAVCCLLLFPFAICPCYHRHSHFVIISHQGLAIWLKMTMFSFSSVFLSVLGYLHGLICSNIFIKYSLIFYPIMIDIGMNFHHHHHNHNNHHHHHNLSFIIQPNLMNCVSIARLDCAIYTRKFVFTCMLYAL